MMIIIASAIAAVPTSQPLSAQTKPTTDAGTAKLNAARVLVQTLKSEQQMRSQATTSAATAGEMFDRLVPVQAAMQAQLTDPQGFARAKEAAIKLIADDRTSLANETIPLVIEAEVRRYADHYSLEELKALETFYLSPIGQRVIAEQPAMSADGSRFQQSILTPIANAHTAAVGPKLAVLLTPLLRSAAYQAGKKP